MTFDTDLTKQRYPGIARATLEMSYCNGGINRNRREKDALEALEIHVLNAGADVAFDLPAISEWLQTLAEDQLQTVVDGEQSEMDELLASAPPGTDMLLNRIFECAA